jgi:organic hydroperoxide reductase OsmC/OhrA
MHTYTATISWKNDSAESFTKGKYSRAHNWSFDGGIDVPASSSVHAVRLPYSVEEAVDPEEALVAAASSCHLLSFLWVVSKKGFVVQSYEDNAVGEMTKNEEGKEWVSKITLDPKIEWSGDNRPAPDELREMHHMAHEYCYIANSIKSEIVVNNIEGTHAKAN